MSNIWRHKKTGGLYTILDEDFKIEATTERGTLYQNLQSGERWIRPFSEFHDGRFEVLNSAEYIDRKVVLSHSDAF